ncbi:MAG: DUF4159 domain-containing protein [Planctomycetales bacterium]|nr:DUF4159 domain-containing protein [Planctomycetales bacterium]
MSEPLQPPIPRRVSGLLLAWLVMVLEQASSHWLPVACYWLLHVAAMIGGGMLWAWAIRGHRQLRDRDTDVSARHRETPRLAAAATAGTLLIWQALLFFSDALLLDAARVSIAQIGTGVIFLIGLGWAVWYVDGKAQALRERRPRRDVFDLQSPPSATELPPRQWHPFHPDAWYYGRSKNRKLNQSIATLATYTLLFVMAFLALTNLQGCQEVYDLPAGGGEEKTVAQTVKVKKVIRKKYVINPYSNIIMNNRVIDDVQLQLQEITEHAYTIGQGEGVGAGFGGGKPRGKVRFIRLEYDGGDWDQDFGVGGDMNMLMEYGIRTQHPVEKQTESRTIAGLGNFRKFRSPPVVYITGQRNISTSKSEDRILREYLLENHGIIFCDNGGSRTFHNQFLALMGRLLPDVRPVPVPLDDRIHRVPFAIPFLPYVAPHGGKEALGWYKDGRWLCYYHPGDIGDAWADGHAGVKPEVWEACYQLGTNVIFYANAEYSKWVLAQEKKE